MPGIVLNTLHIFNPHKNPMKYVLLLSSSLYRLGVWSEERLSDQSVTLT
jgi:hypothetical protein